MTKVKRVFKRVLRKFVLWRTDDAQDLVEYALLAGFVALAAGFFVPDLTASMDTIYSRLASRLAQGAA